MRHLNRKSAALLAVLAGSVAALVVALPAIAGGLPIQNGSFETCDLTAWSSFTATAGGPVGAVGGGNDGDGCQGAVSTGTAAIGAYSWLHHAFYATAGTKVIVYAHFGGDCNGANGGGLDVGYTQVDGSTQWVTCDYLNPYNYEPHIFTVGYTGWHDFFAGAANGFDAIISSTLFIDRLGFLGLTKVT